MPLEELLEAATWTKLGLHSKPCGVLNVAGYYDPPAAMLDAAVTEEFMSVDARETLIFAAAPATLLDRLSSRGRR